MHYLGGGIHFLHLIFDIWGSCNLGFKTHFIIWYLQNHSILHSPNGVIKTDILRNKKWKIAAEFSDLWSRFDLYQALGPNRKSLKSGINNVFRQKTSVQRHPSPCATGVSSSPSPQPAAGSHAEQGEMPGRKRTKGAAPYKLSKARVEKHLNAAPGRVCKNLRSTPRYKKTGNLSDLFSIWFTVGS